MATPLCGVAGAHPRLKLLMPTTMERVHEEASRHGLSSADQTMLRDGEFVSLISRLRQRARASLLRHLFGVAAYYALGWICIGRPIPSYPQWFSVLCAVGFFGMCAVHAALSVISFRESRREAVLLVDLGEEHGAP
ncbi:MAG: hypothetical protein ACI9EF_001412 [Pseudohongiellaceae bacterium]|jgi:hypothetical protein